VRAVVDTVAVTTRLAARASRLQSTGGVGAIEASGTIGGLLRARMPARRATARRPLRAGLRKARNAAC
jgi:hypothetical protein